MKINGYQVISEMLSIQEFNLTSTIKTLNPARRKTAGFLKGVRHSTGWRKKLKNIRNIKDIEKNPLKVGEIRHGMWGPGNWR